MIEEKWIIGDLSSAKTFGEGGLNEVKRGQISGDDECMCRGFEEGSLVLQICRIAEGRDGMRGSGGEKGKL